MGAFYLKADDTQPYYRVKIEDSDGDAVPLSGATIYCTMTSTGGTVKINHQNTGITITDATNGEFEYRWQTGDTDTAGFYVIEFEINPSGGGKFTLPTGEVAEVIIEV